MLNHTAPRGRRDNHNAPESAGWGELPRGGSGGFPRGPAWVMAIAVAVIAASLAARNANDSPAYAQSVRGGGARGVFAFTGELTKGTHGVFMVDVDAGTIWCYEFVPGKRKLRLVAARDWRFDRYLENFETEPPPEVIQEILEEQRQAKMNAAATGDGNP